MKKYYYSYLPMHQANYQITGKVFEKETKTLLPTDVLQYAKDYKSAERILFYMSKDSKFQDLKIMPVPKTHNINDEFVQFD